MPFQGSLFFGQHGFAVPDEFEGVGQGNGVHLVPGKGADGQGVEGGLELEAQPVFLARPGGMEPVGEGLADGLEVKKSAWNRTKTRESGKRFLAAMFSGMQHGH